MIEAKRLRLFQGIEFGRRDVILILSSFLVFGIFMPLYFETGRYAYVAVAGAGGASALFLILRPVIARDERRTNINSNIPLFITAFATLSTSDANRVDLLEILSRKDKIGYIREDLARLVNLVKRWKRGLSEAAMLLASRTPSEVFADFLARFGHAIDSGQDFQEFILNESDTVMSNFETAYISALYTFDLYKDMYVSMLLSFAFLVAFVMIMPVLIPMNVTVVFALSFLAIILGEAVLMYGIKIVLPNDPIWHDTGLRTEVQDHMRRILMMAGAACVAILAVLFATRLVYRIPFYFSVAMVITPLAWPGMVGSRYEREIAKKDEMFGSFIRSLSGSAAARGNMVIDALKSIVMHDFGTLTRDVRNLYKRLRYRINPVQAWRAFSADTGSHLIEVFSESYVESVELGADAGKSGNIVANNFDRVVRLRKRRHSSVTSFVGVIYGITGGLAFSLAISYGVLEIINQVFRTFPPSEISDFGIFIGQPTAALLTIQVFLMAMLIVHSFIAGIALKVSDGGKMIHGLHHGVFMTWMISFIVYGTLIITRLILGTGI